MRMSVFVFDVAPFRFVPACKHESAFRLALSNVRGRAKTGAPRQERSDRNDREQHHCKHRQRQRLQRFRSELFPSGSLRRRLVRQRVHRQLCCAHRIRCRTAQATLQVGSAAAKRTLRTEGSSRAGGFDVGSLVLVAVLLAAGAVLKMTVGSVINIAGMKPNFIIAMYCLAILLVRPKLGQAAVIGLLAGALCQVLPGTPYINFISELAGALAMGALIMVPLKFGKLDLKAPVATFISTVVSGGIYTVCLFLFAGADASAMVAYVPIVLCTAVINTVIVQALYLPLRKVLKKDVAAPAVAAA